MLTRTHLLAAGIATAIAAVAGIEAAETTPDSLVPVMLMWRMPQVNGASVEVVNDLGYRITLTAARVTSSSVELIPCEADASRVSAGDRPAQTAMVRIEDVLDMPAGALLDRISPRPTRYCEARYVVGRAPAASLRGTSRAGASVVLAGAYRQPATDKMVPFAIESGIGDGVVTPLQLAEQPFAATFDPGMRVVVTRDLARAFKGVDFATMSKDEIARRFLHSLLAATRVAVEPPV